MVFLHVRKLGTLIHHRSNICQHHDVSAEKENQPDLCMKGNDVEVTGGLGSAVGCGQTTLKYWVPWQVPQFLGDIDQLEQGK